MQPLLSLLPLPPRRFDALLAASEGLVVQPAGAILDSGRWPSGFSHDRLEGVIGHGQNAFEEARAKLQRWGQFPAVWTGIVADGPPRLGQRVGIHIQLMGLHWGCAGEVVALRDTSTEYGYAYGTLPGHVEEGEEWFGVHLEADGRVVYRIHAFSRPRHWTTRLGYPLVRLAQERFRRESLGVMRGEQSLGWGFGLIVFLWLGVVVGMRPSTRSGDWAMLLLVLLAGLGASLGRQLSLAAVVAWMGLATACFWPIPWLVLPWGAWMAWQTVRAMWPPYSDPSVARSIAWGFGAIGSGWLWVFLHGWTPWGFHPEIQQLTPVHLHAAGWLLASLMVAIGHRRLAGALLFAFAAVACGMVWHQRGGSAWPEQVAASMMVILGLAAAVVMGRRSWWGPAVALSVGMVLALAYIWRGILPDEVETHLDWGGMRALHGSANAVALGWGLIFFRKRSHGDHPIARDL